MSWELPDVEAGANIFWIIEKTRELQKNIYFCFIDCMLKALTMWITTSCGKFFKKWEYQTTLPVSWETYVGEEATIRTGHGTTSWFKIGKGVHQGCILSSCLFNLYAEYIMQNARLDEAPAGTKITRRNVNNLRYADETTLMAESKEELKSLLIRVK